MGHRLRVTLRWLVAIISFIAIIYFQRKTGKAELGYMLLGLVGMIAALFDYNYEFNHPKRD